MPIYEVSDTELAQRILARCITNHETGCWEWLGHAPKRYGLIRNGNKNETVHRVVYRVFKGEIPYGDVVDHLCMNTRCTNPSHLEVVTRAENVRRANKVHNIREKGKKYCPKGHPLEGSHLRISSRGFRSCRTCQNIRYKIYNNPHDPTDICFNCGHLIRQHANKYVTCITCDCRNFKSCSYEMFPRVFEIIK